MIDIKSDSRKVKPGDTFVAINGHTVDGHSYISKAIENGATNLIVEKGKNYTVPFKKVENSEEYLKDILVKNYAEDFEDLKFVGVTGTNGKTTTCYLTYQLLNQLGAKAAYIGTIGFYYDNVKKELPNTTPDILTLYKLIEEAKDAGCTHIVMEVSSHALAMDRIAGLSYDVAAFTNLTQDHLDYHKTMDNYLRTKMQILDKIKKNGHMVVNYDDPHADYFIRDDVNIYTSGIGANKEAFYNIVGAKYEPGHTTIGFKEGVLFDRTIDTNLTSKFNVYNYMTSYAILRALGFRYEDIKEATKYVYPPNGRCEIIPVNNGYAVVDYAHTPDAVEKICTAMNNLKGDAKTITVVGCGGDRDPLKRPIMGEIACKNSDHVIFTNDNPRTEDPELIMYDIVKDLKYNNYEIELDRTKAIRKGIELLNPNDILLVLGKGHEDYQIIGHDKIHLDDHEIINDWKKEHTKVLRKELKPEDKKN